MGIDVPLGLSAPLLRLTAGQVGAMAERGARTGLPWIELPRIELRDGLVCQSSAQHRPHLLAKTAVYDGLRDALRALGSPLGVASGGSVLDGEREVPIPDVLVWEVVPGPGPVPLGLVRLVVEVSDTTPEDDLGRRRAVYAAGGVAEYWAVDLPNQVVHRFRTLAGGTFAADPVVPFGARIAATAVPGLEFDTAALRGRP